MKNLPRRMLRQILTKHGEEIYRDARRCENLLKDLCGADRREINVLINAIEERVPLDLLAANPSMPLELLLTRLEKRLEEQTAMTDEAARWSVESWALALNLATESEIQARRKRIETAASKVSKREIIQPDDPSSGAVSNDNRRNPAQPPKVSPPVSSPRAVPPVMRQPPVLPPSASPAAFPTNTQTINSPSAYLPTANHSAARKSFGLFRGCLIIVFLLAAASVVFFLGVPFAVKKMRETQRERNNEPSRFPVR